MKALRRTIGQRINTLRALAYYRNFYKMPPATARLDQALTEMRAAMLKQFREREDKDEELKVILNGYLIQTAQQPLFLAIDGILNALRVELEGAINGHGPMRSAHEGYAVILEELDELKAEVWKNAKRRDMEVMKTEALQVAAMGCRFMLDVCAPPLYGFKNGQGFLLPNRSGMGLIEIDPPEVVKAQPGEE